MRTIFALAASAIAFTATPALAISPNATDFEIEIDHEDIDLSTEQGVALLDERVRTIIRRECANGGRDSTSVRLKRACRASARAAAEDQIRFAVSEARITAVRLASKKPVAPEA